MSKIANYLQEHLTGEVTDSLEVRRYFSHDASILEIMPSLVVYPASENDVRKAVHFCWQLAQRNKLLPITARGGGTDTSGAAIGSGIILSFTGHMNRILALDPKKEFVTVEPGISFSALQQTLFTHGLMLPPAPASQEYATIGGGLANNSIGEKTVKYGDIRKYTEKLSVVLANGEVIETHPLSKRDFNKKLGLATMEGEVYRAVDSLLEEFHEVIEHERTQMKALYNRVGYNVFDIKKKGSFDLTPLFLGSQGSLGVITEATLQLTRHNPISEICVVSLPDLASFHDILPKILNLKPSICEMMNNVAVQQISQLSPNQLKGILDRPADAIHLIVEFDDDKEGAQKKALKDLKKLTEKSAGHWQAVNTPEDREKVSKLRHALATLFWDERGGARAVPVAEDVSVPTDRLADFLDQAVGAYQAHNLVPAIWGHAGDGIVRMSPSLNLSQVGDRQRLYKISDVIYKAAVTMGGSITGSAGDGRVRAPYVGHVHGPDMQKLMVEIKKAFDPYGILNRGVKFATADEVKSMMRSEYNLARHDHLPRG